VYLWKSADFSLRRWQIDNGMSLEYSLMREGHCRSRMPHSYENIALKHLRWQTLLYLNCVSCALRNVYHQVPSAPSFLKFLSSKFVVVFFLLIFLFMYQPIYGSTSNDPPQFKRAAGHKDLFYIDDKDVDIKDVRFLGTSRLLFYWKVVELLLDMVFSHFSWFV